MCLKYTWTTFKTLLTFHRIGWFREILISAYCITIPILPGCTIPSNRANKQGFGHCSNVHFDRISLSLHFPILAPKFPTPRKIIRLEPENRPPGRGKWSEPNHHFQVLCWSSGVYSSSWWNPTMFSSSVAPGLCLPHTGFPVQASPTSRG